MVIVQVMDMEREVQNFLNFEMGIPTIKNFLRQERCKMLLVCRFYLALKVLFTMASVLIAYIEFVLGSCFSFHTCG